MGVIQKGFYTRPGLFILLTIAVVASLRCFCKHKQRKQEPRGDVRLKQITPLCKRTVLSTCNIASMWCLYKFPYLSIPVSCCYHVTLINVIVVSRDHKSTYPRF